MFHANSSEWSLRLAHYINDVHGLKDDIEEVNTLYSINIENFYIR